MASATIATGLTIGSMARRIPSSPRRHVEALKKAAPPRVVALSSMDADRTSGLEIIIALSLLEQGFRNLTTSIAFVRAGGFLENFLYGPHVAQGGALPVYYNPTNRKSTMVATNDIGAEVAILLSGPACSGPGVIELSSMVSAYEVAEQLGEILCRNLKASAVARAGWAEVFEQQFGIPKGRTGPAEDMFDAVNAGWMDLGGEGAEHVAGTTSTKVDGPGPKPWRRSGPPQRCRMRMEGRLTPPEPARAGHSHPLSQGKSRDIAEAPDPWTLRFDEWDQSR